MGFLEKFFNKNKPKEPIEKFKLSELPEFKLNKLPGIELNKSPKVKVNKESVEIINEPKEQLEIVEEGKEIYFEISQEIITIGRVKQIFNEIKENSDIPALIRESFSINVDGNKKVLRFTFNTENFSHIPNFKEEAKKILKEIKEKLEKENKSKYF